MIIDDGSKSGLANVLPKPKTSSANRGELFQEKFSVHNRTQWCVVATYHFIYRITYFRFLRSGTIFDACEITNLTLKIITDDSVDQPGVFSGNHFNMVTTNY